MPAGVTGRPLVQEPPSREPTLGTVPRTKSKGTSAEPSVFRAPVYGPEQTLTLNVHIRNANAWPNVQARLKALPYAALCVQCKSGGLSRR